MEIGSVYTFPVKQDGKKIGTKYAVNLVFATKEEAVQWRAMAIELAGKSNE